MKKLERLGELFIYIILFILILSFNFAKYNWELFLFWQPIIDDIILLVFLIFMVINSSNWNWISKRLLYGLIFILLLNTYGKLFGMNSGIYLNCYIIPVISLVLSLFISYTFKIIYKLYILWKDGKIKFY